MRQFDSFLPVQSFLAEQCCKVMLNGGAKHHKRDEQYIPREFSDRGQFLFQLLGEGLGELITRNTNRLTRILQCIFDGDGVPVFADIIPILVASSE
jgi:hypothetical protein